MSFFRGVASQVAQHALGTAAAAAGTAATYYIVTNVPSLIKKLPRQSPIQQKTVDLTARAQKGQLKKVHGRQQLIERIIATISTAYGFGILLGSPGVGKTALVQHLACLTAEGSVPSLRDFRIVELNLGKVQGRGVASALSQLLQGGVDQFFDDLLEELRKLNTTGARKTIVFIDEIHELFESFPNVFDNKKQLLAERGVFILGATTNEKAIDAWLGRSESAFERRHQTIKIPEMTGPETEGILQGKRVEARAEHPTLRIEDSALEACVGLSGKLFPKGVFPDRAIKLFNQVVTWASNRLKEALTAQDVADYLARGLVGEDAETLYECWQKEKDRGVIRERFDTLYFPKISGRRNAGIEHPYIQAGGERLMSAFAIAAPAEERPELVPSPGAEGPQSEADAILDEVLDDFDAPGAASAESHRRKQAVVLAGRSSAVLRSVVDSFALQGVTTHRCSLKQLCAIAEKERSIHDWTERFLTRLASADSPVVLHIEEADDLLAFLKPHSVSSSSSSSYMGSGVQMLGRVRESQAGRVLDRLSQQTLGISAFDVVSSVDAASPAAAQSATARTSSSDERDLIQLLAKYVQERKIDIVISAKSSLEGFHAVSLSPMQPQEMAAWLSASYADPRPDAGEGSIPFPLLPFIAAQLAPHGAPEDYCCQLLNAARRAPQATLVDVAFSLTRGTREKAEIQGVWEKARRLERPIFHAIEAVPEANPQLTPELRQALRTSIEAGESVLWVEGESELQAAYTGEQVSQYLVQAQKSVWRLDLSAIRAERLDAELERGIVEHHFAQFLEGARQGLPVLMLEEKDFRNPHVKQKIVELTGAKRIQVVCFAAKRQEQAQSGQVAVALGALEEVGRNFIQEGARAVGLGSLLPTAAAPVQNPTSAPVSEWGQIPVQRIRENSPTFEILIPYVLKKEMGQLTHGEGGISLSVEAIHAFTRLYAFLAEKEKLSADAIRQAIRTDLGHFQQTGVLNALSQTQIIERITAHYGSPERLTSNELKYTVQPLLTPLTYRIWRVFKEAVVSVGKAAAVPLHFVYSWISSPYRLMAGASLFSTLAAARRFLGF